MTLGKKILPWRNPISYPSRGLRGSEVAFPPPRAYTIATGSTTDTTNYTQVAAVNAVTNAPLIRSRKSYLMIAPAVQFKHSVANARMDFLITIYDAAPAVAALVSNGFLNLAMPATAGDYLAVAPTFWFDLDFIGANPGFHALAIFARPDTAGTLTWADAGGSDSWGWLEISST